MIGGALSLARCCGRGEADGGGYGARKGGRVAVKRGEGDLAPERKRRPRAA